MLWDGRRAPFTLLGGYLGAGKTTVLNHLVRHGGDRRLVVLVNDVGSVAVDAALIADHDGTTMSLTNGCVCCSIADDLGETLEAVREMTAPPDAVVMELSGVAEPSRVAPWANTAGFRLDGIVVVVDGEQVAGQCDREYVGSTVRAQLATADLILVTKLDLVADGGRAARRTIRSSSSAPIVGASHGVVEPSIVMGLDVAEAPVAAAPQPGLHSTRTLELAPMTIAELDARLAALPASVVRAKGVLMCTDVDVPVEAQVVGPRRRVVRRPDLPADVAGRCLVVIEPTSGEISR